MSPSPQLCRCLPERRRAPTHERRQHSEWSEPSPPGGPARLVIGTPRWRPPLSSGPTSVWRQPSLSADLRGRQRAAQSFWSSGCGPRICTMLLRDTATLRLDLPPPRAVLAGSPPSGTSQWDHAFPGTGRPLHTLQGRRWQTTLQPFLQERKHYSNRASSGETDSVSVRRFALLKELTGWLSDWGLAPGVAVDGASRWGRMCWIASVCCCTAENCWAKPRRRESVPCQRPSFISARLSQRWCSWTTMVDIAFPRDRAVTFVARRAKSVAVRSSCINPGSVLPSCTCLSALAWWTCRIAMACRAEAVWPAAL